MKIRCGTLDALSCGVITTPSMEDTEFTLREEPPMVLVFRVKKQADTPAGIELNLESETRLIVTYNNPAIQLNFGPQHAIDLGSLNGRKLRGCLRVNVMGDYSSYQVAYSFFLGEALK